MKLCKEAKEGVTTSRRYYAGSFEYDNARALKMIHHEEGIVVVSGGTSYSYEYFLKDHLGNTRIVFSSTGGVMQRTDYYPFGMVAGTPFSSSTDNKYLFGGKELQDDQIGGVQLGVYDFIGRTYDPQTGRFWQIDPLAEKSRRWSPYVYCFDNPLRFIDPDGLFPEDPKKVLKSPVGNATVTSSYGEKRTIGSTPHKGVDYGVTPGTTVQTTANGTVARVGLDPKGYGKFVVVDHGKNESGDHIYSMYGHNSKINVEQGKEVKAGDQIAESGNTGLSSGPHSHYEVKVTSETPFTNAFFKDNNQINPSDLGQALGVNSSDNDVETSSGTQPQLSQKEYSFGDALQSSNVPIVKTLGDVVKGIENLFK